MEDVSGVTIEIIKKSISDDDSTPISRGVDNVSTNSEGSHETDTTMSSIRSELPPEEIVIVEEHRVDATKMMRGDAQISSSSEVRRATDSAIDEQNYKLDRMLDKINILEMKEEELDYKKQEIMNIQQKFDNKCRRYDLILKENEKYKRKFNKERFKNALNMLARDSNNLEFNELINGFGIIVRKYNETKYMMIYDKKYLKDIEFKNVQRKDNVLKLTKLDDSSITYEYNPKQKFHFDILLKEVMKLNDLENRRHTKSILTQLLEYIKYKRDTHGEAKNVFFQSNLGFVIPSITVTAVSGVLAFLASSDSDQIDPVTSHWLAIIVGILSFLSTFLQAFSGAMNYNGKSEAHGIANEEYDTLFTKIDFEITNPNESITNTNKFFDQTRNGILDIKKKCKYIVPSEIDIKYKKEVMNNKFDRMRNQVLESAMKRKTDLIKIEVSQEEKDNIDLESINEKLDFMV